MMKREENQTGIESTSMLSSKQQEYAASETFSPSRHFWTLSFAFFFIFNSYICLETLQSSLNAKEGIGLYSLSTLYGTTIFSSFFASPIIHRLTVKRALLLAWCAHVLYVSSNYYPEYWTLIPASSILGFFTSIVWTCQGIYVSRFAMLAAKRDEKRQVALLSQFFGNFQMLMSFTPLGGSLLSGLLFSISTFSQAFTNSTNLDSNYNFTSAIGYSFNTTLPYVKNTTNYSRKTEQCGSSYCIDRSASGGSDKSAVSIQTRYILISLFLLLDLVGIILTCTLTNLPKQPYVIRQRCVEKVCGGILFLRTVKFLLMVPVYVMIYCTGAVMTGLYTKGFITCTTNIRMVSFAMLCYGTTMIISSAVSGYMGKCVHRNWHFAIGFAAVISFCMMTLFWDPASTHFILLFIPSAMVGLARSFIMTQLQALLGLLFEGRKEAFSMKTMVTSTANCATFVMCSFLCYRHIIYILLILIVIAISSYISLAIMLYRETKVKNKLEIINE